jgi:hypothetical protein
MQLQGPPRVWSAVKSVEILFVHTRILALRSFGKAIVEQLTKIDRSQSIHAG